MAEDREAVLRRWRQGLITGELQMADLVKFLNRKSSNDPGKLRAAAVALGEVMTALRNVLERPPNSTL